jgi:hypothetical protein
MVHWCLVRCFIDNAARCDTAISIFRPFLYLWHFILTHCLPAGLAYCFKLRFALMWLFKIPFFSIIIVHQCWDKTSTYTKQNKQSQVVWSLLQNHTARDLRFKVTKLAPYGPETLCWTLLLDSTFWQFRCFDFFFSMQNVFKLGIIQDHV